MEDVAHRPIGGVPYHCPSCEVGWFDSSHVPSRCWMPKCGEFGVKGGVAEKCLWSSNRSTIERSAPSSGSLWRDRFPFLRSVIHTHGV